MEHCPNCGGGELELIAAILERPVIDGFWRIDEEKVKALPDATVLELHRNGLHNFMQSHWVSLGHMRLLLGRRILSEATKQQARGRACSDLSDA